MEFHDGLEPPIVHDRSGSWFSKTLDQPATACVTPPYGVSGHPTKFLTSTPQNCQSHRKQGKSEKLSPPRGANGDVTTESNMVS